MKNTTYTPPTLSEYEILSEGILCESLNLNDNESYGGVPEIGNEIF